MKRLLIVLLAAIVVFTLFGCSFGETSEVSSPDDVNTKADNTVSTTQQGTSATTKAETNTTPKTPETIAETVLVDEQGVKITVKSLDKKGLFGPEIKILIENNSGVDLTFDCDDSSVNGYMMSASLYSKVANGKKANEKITFLNSDLEDCGINTIADIEFSFHIYNSNTYKDYLNTSPIILKTSAYDNYEYKFDDSGKVIYEGNDIKIVVKKLESDFMGQYLYYYIENNNKNDISLQSKSISINGFMIDSLIVTNVKSGKHAVDKKIFLDSELEENGIEKINEICISFRIYDPNHYKTIDETGEITISFN